MSATLRKISAGYISYLTDSINDQLPSAVYRNGVSLAASSYYTQPGNPPGVWLGSGLNMVDRKAGTSAAKWEVGKLFDELKNPADGKSLMGSRKIQTKSNNNAARSTVAGYDITFSCPKAVSILWAVADRELSSKIEEIFLSTVDDCIKEFEKTCAYTRLGKGGVARVKVDGVSALRFEHYDNRDLEPHLHAHATVSNFVLRPDGKIGTLDGKLVYSDLGRISRMHEAMLIDRLSSRLGIGFAQRKTVGIQDKFVYDVDGMPDRLVEAFSQRRIELVKRWKKNVAEYRQQNGEWPDERKLAQMRVDAWTATRKKKPEKLETVSQLRKRWKTECAEQGFSPEAVVNAVTGRNIISDNAVANSEQAMNRLRYIIWNELAKTGQLRGVGQDGLVVGFSTAENAADKYMTDDKVEAALIKKAQTSRTAFTRSNIESVIFQVTMGIRFSDDALRRSFVSDLTEKIADKLVKVNPKYFKLPEELKDNPFFSYKDKYDTVVFDAAGASEQFVTEELWKNEEEFMRIADRDNVGPETCSRSAVVERLDKMREAEEMLLDKDQAAAVADIVSTNAGTWALTGYAGTGKTTTLKAALKILDEYVGADKVLGLSPTARGAKELENSLGKATNTVAAVVTESVHHAAAKKIMRLENMIASGKLSEERRLAAEQQLAAAVAQRCRLEIPQNGIVIVDEASMLDTVSAASLAKLCEQKNARIILVGDPMQLAAAGTGHGGFDYVISQKRESKIAGLHRFRIDGFETVVKGLAHGTTVEMKKKIEYAIWAKEFDFRDMTDEEREKEKKKEWERIEQRHLKEGIFSLPGMRSAVNDMEHFGCIVPCKDNEARNEAFKTMLEDYRSGKDSVLTVGDNENVSNLNAMFAEKLKSDGITDAEPARRLTLCDGVAYGRGDLICTRQNSYNYKKTGTDILNGDLWKIRKINTAYSETEKRNIIVSAEIEGIDKTENAVVTVDASYLQKYAHGGYVSTVYRTQGATKANSYTLIPAGASMTRNVLYVAMTRGRTVNKAFVEIPDVSEADGQNADMVFWHNAKKEFFEKHMRKARWTAAGQPPNRDDWYHPDDLKPTEIELAKRRLNEIIDVASDTKTAHMTRDDYIAAHTGDLQILKARRNYLNAMFASEKLEARLKEILGEQAAARLKGDDRWENLCEVWLQAYKSLDSSEDILRSGGDSAETRLREILEKPVEDSERVRLKEPEDADMSETVALGKQAALAAAVKVLPDPGYAPGETFEIKKAGESIFHVLDTLAIEYEKNGDGSANIDERYAKAVAVFLSVWQDRTGCAPAGYLSNWEELEKHIPSLTEQTALFNAETDGELKTDAEVLADRLKKAGSVHETDTSLHSFPRPLIETDEDRATADLLQQNSLMVKKIKEKEYEAIDRFLKTGDDSQAPSWAEKIPRKGSSASEYARLAKAVLSYRWENDCWDSESLLGPRPSNPEDRARRNRLARKYNAFIASNSILDNGDKKKMMIKILPIEQIDAQTPQTETETVLHGETAGKPVRQRSNFSWQNRMRPARDHFKKPDRAKAARIEKINAQVWKFWKNKDRQAWVPLRLKERGLDASFAGWAPTKTEDLLEWAAQKNISVEDLELAGLVMRGKHGRRKPVAVFRDRAVMPVRNEKDAIIGFVGLKNPQAEFNRQARDPANDYYYYSADKPVKKDEIPKYLNTKTTEAYVKSRSLYGLNRQTAERLRNGAAAVICEGILDAEAYRRAIDADETLKNRFVPLAICGTEITDSQLNVVRRLQKRGGGEIIFCFDKDESGREAENKAWEKLTQSERETAGIAELPDSMRDAAQVAEDYGWGENEFYNLSAAEVFSISLKSSVKMWEYMAGKIIEQNPENTQKALDKIEKNVIRAMKENSDEYIRACHTHNRMRNIEDLNENRFWSAIPFSCAETGARNGSNIIFCADKELQRKYDQFLASGEYSLKVRKDEDIKDFTCCPYVTVNMEEMTEETLNILREARQALKKENADAIEGMKELCAGSPDAEEKISEFRAFHERLKCKTGKIYFDFGNKPDRAVMHKIGNMLSAAERNEAKKISLPAEAYDPSDYKTAENGLSCIKYGSAAWRGIKNTLDSAYEETVAAQTKAASEEQHFAASEMRSNQASRENAAAEI